MKSIKRTVLVVVANFFSLMNQLIPKNPRKILFYSDSKYNDNDRSLFEYMVRKNYQDKFLLYYSVQNSFLDFTDKRIIFISKLRALFVFLNSKYVFYDVGTTRIRPSKHQCVVQLWHGTPLKKIGREVVKTSKNDRFNDFTYVLTTSENFINIFTDSFECKKEQVIVCGYPRNDDLFTQSEFIINKFNLKFYKKNILWMPTFRKYAHGIQDIRDEDFSLSFFNGVEELKELNSYLAEHNYSLTIKLHPVSIDNYINYPKFSNINIINIDLLKNINVLNYNLVSCFDCLITDYSSIYFDYLLLDKPIGFVVDDMNSYGNSRGFTFENPKEYMPGKIILDKEVFYDFLSNMEAIDSEYKIERKRVRDFAHTKIQTNNGAEELLKIIGLEG